MLIICDFSGHAIFSVAIAATQGFHLFSFMFVVLYLVAALVQVTCTVLLLYPVAALVQVTCTVVLLCPVAV